MKSRERTIKSLINLGVLAVLLAAAPMLRADGFIIPSPRPGQDIPPLSVKYHHVTVEIVDQVAKTSVDQVFVNHFGRDIEGTYIFPVPEGASVSEFAMYIGNERVKGEILDSREARRVYEDIVRRMRDPGLLEYIGRNLFRARVFPIPANGEKRVQISYTEVLKSDGGLVKYLYPLNTERFSRDPLEDVSISVRIESRTPILNVYSPSHKVSVRKDGPGRARVGYEDKRVRPDKDFLVYYSLSKDDVGLSFLNWEGPDGGVFMLLASPRFAATGERVVNKTIVLVLDSSGSMSGAKMHQAKEAVRFILNHLDRRDEFTLIDFDDGVTAFSETLVPATAENIGRALKFVEAIEDTGGTNINDALLAALARLRTGGERPNYVLFLTDGLPTAGTTETADILRNIQKANDARARVFVFGVGNDVNTELLDRISTDHRGTSVYIGEDENLEVAVSSFYEKISSPLLSDLAVTFRGIETSQVYPRSLPDLFKGSQLVLVGKYRGKGPVSVALTGKSGREEKRFVLEGRVIAKDDSFNFLPRLWATRRIGYLIEEIRLQGSNQELVDEIGRLGLKYGIVTPYTSFLVTEKEAQALDAAAPAAREAIVGGVVGGVGAVRVAKATQAFKLEDRAAQVASERILYKDDKTFYFKDGVWTDSEYEEGAPVTEFKFNSDAFYKLIVEKPGLAKYLSAGNKLVVVFEGVSYRIVD
ncbi:MAG: VIT and VWA domain-containing protein [Candidatus Aminicenantes bacterium]|nr:VIT and VWA domain-containing protein [Candidatus Aminicenantes bacterium]